MEILMRKRLRLRDSSISGHVLAQIADGVALNCHGSGCPGEAGGGGGIDAGSMVHKIGIETAGLDLLFGEAPGELVDDGSDHLQVAQFVRTMRIYMSIF